MSRHPVSVKVCGLTREQDVALCLELGVDFTGFIFVPGSPRRISPEEAAAMPSGKAKRVGVFASQSIEEVVDVMKEAKLDFAQLHGGESVEYCNLLGAERVIRAFWPQRIARDLLAGSNGAVKDGPEESDVFAAAFAQKMHETCEPFADACAFFLMDSGLGGGGSGLAQNWDLFKDFSSPRPWLLAGGIGPDNARAAVEACGPGGLDCNSGVEQAPGIKDEHKLRKLMANLNTIKSGAIR